MAGVLLNVADIRHRSRVNGPGLRSVVWVQGCSIGCPGCFNPHTHPHRPVQLLNPAALGRRLAQLEGTDGLTISGGEPFEQAEAGAILAATVHARRLSVMVFTGYTYAYLRRCAFAAVPAFLANIDILIAGPYVERLYCDGALWRSSTNQTVNVLSERGRAAVAVARQRSPVVEITADGSHFAYSGLPAREDRRWLERLAEATAPHAGADRAQSREE